MKNNGQKIIYGKTKCAECGEEVSLEYTTWSDVLVSHVCKKCFERRNK